MLHYNKYFIPCSLVTIKSEPGVTNIESCESDAKKSEGEALS
jgi:hypothetical protein